jgi:hypothetical protein
VKAGQYGVDKIDETIYTDVLADIKCGKAFPTLEASFQRAVANSEDRKWVLYLLAAQPEENTMFDVEKGLILLKKARKDADDLNIEYVDQLIPRLLDPKFGPVLSRVSDRVGVYEFINPVFRVYVQLRQM